MEELRRERDRTTAQAFGLVASTVGHSTLARNADNDDDFWDEKPEGCSR